MWGIIPAAGLGSRIQPLSFSKELLPVGSTYELGLERPRAVSEYLVERMILAGASKLCFVISAAKTDILDHFGGRTNGADLAYVVQDEAHGLCDAIFRAAPLIPSDEEVLIGLPDTVWFPKEGFALLPGDSLSFLLFPVANPECFDAVVLDERLGVRRIEVKSAHASTQWVWGAMRMPGNVFQKLHQLWCQPERRDEYFGTLVNAWLALGNKAVGVPAGETYIDVGTFSGYRSATRLFDRSLKEEVSLRMEDSKERG